MSSQWSQETEDKWGNGNENKSSQRNPQISNSINLLRSQLPNFHVLPVF